MKYFITFLLLSSFIGFAREQKLAELLNIKPGMSEAKLKKKIENDHYFFELESSQGKVISVEISFKKLPALKDYLNLKDEGFCLAQKAPGDIKYNYHYFISKDLSKRYLITPNSKIKNITIFDFSKVDKSETCNLKTLLTKIKNQQGAN